MDREEEIKQTAYQLWEQEGHPEGRDLEFWLRAEAVWQTQHEREQSPAPAGPL